jgi:alpha-glucuronidase
LKTTTHVVFVLACALFAVALDHAETGHDGWLRYAQLQPAADERYRALPATTFSLSDTLVLNTAQAELVRGVKGTLGRTLRVASGVPTESAIVIGTAVQLRTIAPALHIIEGLRGDAFWLIAEEVRGFRCIIITGATRARSALWSGSRFSARLQDRRMCSS